VPVLHRRENESGFYVRGRVAGAWVTWQVTIEGEAWLEENRFDDGDSFDLDLVEMFQVKGWLYTGGSGPGRAFQNWQPTFLRVGEGVQHQEFGIGQIRELLKDGRCRVVFFREYPQTRDVLSSELTAPRSIDLARERSAAFTRAAQAKPVVSIPLDPPTQVIIQRGTNTVDIQSGVSPSRGCLSSSAAIAILVVIGLVIVIV